MPGLGGGAREGLVSRCWVGSFESMLCRTWRVGMAGVWISCHSGQGGTVCQKQCMTPPRKNPSSSLFSARLTARKVLHSILPENDPFPATAAAAAAAPGLFNPAAPSSCAPVPAEAEAGKPPAGSEAACTACTA